MVASNTRAKVLGYFIKMLRVNKDRAGISKTNLTFVNIYKNGSV